MVADASERLLHMKESIASIRQLLAGKTIDHVRSEPVTKAAFERFLEIVSEASRRVPEEWKRSFGADIPWPQIANIGNALRHAYDNVDLNILWSVYQNDIDSLDRAVDAMLAAHPPTESSP
jgi:uncharacterized protein with HEPN domain